MRGLHQETERFHRVDDILLHAGLGLAESQMLLDVNVADGLLIAGGTERVGLTGALLLEELDELKALAAAWFDIPTRGSKA